MKKRLLFVDDEELVLQGLQRMLRPMRQEWDVEIADVPSLVAEVWAELLDVSAIGAHDGFFALGGHSLLVMELCARLRAILETIND